MSQQQLASRLPCWMSPTAVSQCYFKYCLFQTGKKTPSMWLHGLCDLRQNRYASKVNFWGFLLVKNQITTIEFAQFLCSCFKNKAPMKEFYSFLQRYGPKSKSNSGNCQWLTFWEHLCMKFLSPVLLARLHLNSPLLKTTVSSPLLCIQGEITLFSVEWKIKTLVVYSVLGAGDLLEGQFCACFCGHIPVV